MYVITCKRAKGYRKTFYRKFNTLSDLAKYIEESHKVCFSNLWSELTKREMRILYEKIISLQNKKYNNAE